MQYSLHPGLTAEAMLGIWVQWLLSCTQSWDGADMTLTSHKYWISNPEKFSESQWRVLWKSWRAEAIRERVRTSFTEGLRTEVRANLWLGINWVSWGRERGKGEFQKVGLAPCRAQTWGTSGDGAQREWWVAGRWARDVPALVKELSLILGATNSWWSVEAGSDCELTPPSSDCKVEEEWGQGAGGSGNKVRLREI